MNSKFLKTIGCLAIALALAACSSEELADSNELPEGKYPITFTATGLQAMTQSRATADGIWTGGEKVAVKIDNETKEYAADATGKLTSNSPFYWQSTSDSYNVTAWMTDGGKFYFNNLPNSFSVAEDQSKSDDYQSGDFLYAHGTLSYNGNESLTFYHQVAKVVVHVISGDDTPTGMSVNDMKTRELLKEALTWNAPTGDENYGTRIPHELDGYINIWPLAFESGEITLPDNTKATPLASYKFLIIPQEVKADGSALFIINPTKGVGPFSYTPTADIEWKAGQEYTYYIRIKGDKVTATVSTSIGWTEGSAGTGSVEIE